MPTRKFHVTDTELAVLQILWDRERATTREVCDELYPEGTASQYYTVQKLLERLEARECVSRDRSSRVHVFEASIGRDELIQERLRDLSDSLCDGSVIPMLSGLIQMRRWTSQEQDQLASLLEELSDKRTKPKAKRKKS